MMFYDLLGVRGSHSWVISEVRNVPERIDQIVPLAQHDYRPSQGRLFSDAHKPCTKRLEGDEIVEIYIAERSFEASNLFGPIFRGLVNNYASWWSLRSPIGNPPALPERLPKFDL